MLPYIPRIGTWLLMSLCLLLAVPAPSRAQGKSDVSVSVQAPQSMYVGDRVNFAIAISGSRDVSVPSIPSDAALDFAYAGPSDHTSSMIEVINGRVERRDTINYSHIFALTAKSPGRHTIAPIEVTVAGQRYLTDPFVIDVLEPKAATEASLSVVLDHKSAYVGEPVRVTLTLALGLNPRGFMLSLPVQSGDTPADILPPVDPRPAGVNPRDQRFIEFMLNGERTIGRVGQVQLGDRAVPAVIVEQVIIPRAPGVLRIGPARADISAIIGQRARRPLDSFFDDLNITERQYVQAPQLELTVRALPLDGRPADFSGLVGNYAISAASDTTEATVGDPINLAVTVTGPYPLSLVPPLDLNAQESLRGKFRLPRDPILADTSAEAARFDALIRPRTAEISEIGPIELNYFDTATGTYKVMATKPLPLMVRPGTQVAMPGEDDDDASPSPDAAPGLPHGLAGIDRTPLSTVDTGFALMHELTRPRTLAIIAAPPVAYAAAMGLLLLKRRRERDPARRRRLRAARAFRSAIRGIKPDAHTPAGLDALAHALSNFAADWSGEHVDALTAAQAANVFASADTPPGRDLADIVRTIDAVRFDAAQPQHAPLPAHPVAASARLVQRFARESQIRRAGA